MTEVSLRKASELVGIVVKDQVLWYVCKVCGKTRNRSDNLSNHTSRNHGFKVLGLTKTPKVLPLDDLDTKEVVMSVVSAAGKRKKNCTANPEPRLAPKKSLSLGARDVVLARASSSSEVLANSPGVTNSLDTGAQFETISNASFEGNDRSPAGLADIGFRGMSPMDGGGLEEALQVATSGEAGPPRLELVDVQVSAEPRVPADQSGGGVPSAMAGGQGNMTERGCLERLHDQIRGAEPNVEIVVENITATLLAMPPPWQAFRVFEALAIRYVDMDHAVLMGLIRACIRSAKALTTEVRYRSAGDWNYADAVRSSWI